METNHPNRAEDLDRIIRHSQTSLKVNIRTISQLRLKASRDRSSQDRAADAITSFSGRIVFVYLDIARFSIWVFLNTGRFGVHPFGLLTMVVSLEAIFLFHTRAHHAEPSKQGSGTSR